MKTTSCRSVERRAKFAILSVADAEGCSDDVRLRALARLDALIHGCIIQLESQQPKRDPKKFEPVYI